MALYDPGTIEEGDPVMIRAEADELKTVAANIHTVAAMLRTVSTKGVWDSCAGTTFDAEVGATPDDLVAIANRLAGTERIIRPYAERLETSQAALTRIRARYDANVTTSQDRKATLATMTPEDPQYARVDREYRAASNARQTNKREFTREAEEASVDERAVATRLGDVAPDLTDPRAYNAFEKSSRVGTSSLVHNPVVDWLPVFRPMSVLGVGDPVGKLGRRVVYGEGSYKDVGASTLLAGLNTALPVSKRVAAKNTFRASGRAEHLRGIKAADKSTNPIARKRIVANAKVSARHQVATSKVWLKDKVSDIVAQKSGARLIDDFATDWAAVAGSGRVRKGGVVIKYSVRATNHTVEQVAAVKKHKESYDRLTETSSERTARQQQEEAAERRKVADQQRRDAAVDDLTTRPVASPIP